MLYHLLFYRSLTQTQMAAAVLDRGGLPNRIVRAPREIAVEGCSHCIRLGQGYLHRALTLLGERGLTPSHIYVTVGERSYEEVLL